MSQIYCQNTKAAEKQNQDSIDRYVHQGMNQNQRTTTVLESLYAAPTWERRDKDY